MNTTEVSTLASTDLLVIDHPGDKPGDMDDRERILSSFIDQPSKSFSVDSLVNPLVAAASPLFTLACQLRGIKASPHLGSLHHELCYEIRAFENTAHLKGYRTQLILAARYQLCALIDEAILSTDWGRKNDWLGHSLLQTYQHEAWGGERFFLIIDRCSEDPRLYIDMLELSYICLSLGYKGKYSQASQDDEELIQIRDNIYRIIRHHRGEASRKLLIHSSKPEIARRRHWYLPGPVVTSLIVVAVLISSFAVYNYKLNQSTAPISQMLQHLADDSASTGGDAS